MERDLASLVGSLSMPLLFGLVAVCIVVLIEESGYDLSGDGELA